MQVLKEKLFYRKSLSDISEWLEAFIYPRIVQILEEFP